MTSQKMDAYLQELRIGQEDVDYTLMETIISFGEFARASGYSIPSDYAEVAFSALADMPNDGLTFETSEPVLKAIIVKTPEESRRFHHDFMTFRDVRVSHNQQLNKAREDVKNAPANQKLAQQKLDEESKQLQEEMNDFGQNQSKALKLKSQKSSKIQQNIEEHADDFDKLFKEDPNYDLLKRIGEIANGDDPTQKMELVEKQESLKASLKKGLSKLGQVDDPLAMIDLTNDMGKIITKAASAKKKLQKQIEAFEARKEELANKQAEIKQMEENARKRLNDLFNSFANEQRKIKKQSLKHRESFDSNTAHNAVVALGEGTPAFMDKKFNKLTREEQDLLKDYICQNARAFRTRISGRIRTSAHRKIDMEETCKRACRSNGIPLSLAFERPKRQKANIVMLLDVSGSCRDASELMLTFMYYMREVFPGGCKSYAFVNSLYDISRLFDEPDSDSAIAKVLNTIPTRGVYSDYGRPIREYKESHMSDINKDTIVVWIGDARNNRNAAEDDEFKNIAHRAKKTYWLNTEKQNEWNQGDSIFAKYSRYCTRIAEAVSPAELIGFLTQM